MATYTASVIAVTSRRAPKVRQHNWTAQHGFPCGAGAAWDKLASFETLSERRTASLAAWQALPTVLSDEHAMEWRLEALPPAAAAAAAAAARVDREGRQSDLLRAAKQGNSVALIATVAAGVNIDSAADECGLTAVMLAAWHGHTTVLKALAWSGATFVADVSGGKRKPVQTPSGATAFEAAASQGHTAAAEFIAEQYRQPSLTLDADVAGGRRAGLAVDATFACVSDRLQLNPCGELTTLVPVTSSHRGAGAAYLDKAGTDCFIDRLHNLFRTLKVTTDGVDYGSASRGKGLGPSRRHFSDVTGWVRAGLEAGLRRYAAHLSAGSGGAASSTVKVEALPRMRFLCYEHVGGIMYVSQADAHTCTSAHARALLAHPLFSPSFFWYLCLGERKLAVLTSVLT